MPLNIKKSSLQRIFEYGLKAIRKQGKAAVHGNSCVYEAADGTCCIVGHMLAGETRAAAMAQDIGSLRSANGKAFFEPIVGKSEKKKYEMLKAMQYAHDSASSGPDFLIRFEVSMQRVAEEFGLKYAPPGVTLRT